MGTMPTTAIYSVFECRCKNIWIEVAKVASYKVCPACFAKVYGEHVTNVTASMTPKKFFTPTYFKANFYSEQDVKNYPDDPVISCLKKNNFKLVKPSNNWEIILRYEDKCNRVAFFTKSYGASSMNLYVVAPKDDVIFDEIKEAIKKAKEEKKTAAAILEQEKLKIESMFDAAKQTLKVGDYVTYWASKTIEFGKVKNFEKVTVGWRQKEITVMAKVETLKGQVIPTPKSSDQIFKISDEMALLLLLEK